MKKRILFFLYFTLFVLVSVLGVKIYNYSKVLEIIDISKLSFNLEDDTIKISITRNDNFFINEFSCKAINKENKEEITSNGVNNTCELILPTPNDFDIIITSGKLSSKSYDLLDYFDNKLSFSFDKDVIYMVVGEQVKIPYTKKSLTKNTDEYHFVSDNSDIVSTSGDVLVANGTGSANISVDGGISSLKVVVTDLITLPTLSVDKKPVVPCGRYSEEENDLLDLYLSLRVNEAGISTRAGAIAAARFLMLEFPYRIPYFYENGRIHESGVNWADGEGRYYHTGLYLNPKKFEYLEKSYSGPSTWGCPLWNWEDDPKWGFIYGTKVPNGLDCSGFVAWTLKNGGFDPGDIGAGESEYPYQMTDLGEFVHLTDELINSGKIKVGDLFNYWGHISILIGMDNDNFYIAESLQTFGGAVVRTYPKNKVSNTFEYVVLMDKFYKEDGNYSEMWKQKD